MDYGLLGIAFAIGFYAPTIFEDEPAPLVCVASGLGAAIVTAAMIYVVRADF